MEIKETKNRPTSDFEKRQIVGLPLRRSRSLYCRFIDQGLVLGMHLTYHKNHRIQIKPPGEEINSQWREETEIDSKTFSCNIFVSRDGMCRKKGGRISDVFPGC